MSVETIENVRVEGVLVKTVRAYPSKSMMFEAMADFMARGFNSLSTTKRKTGRNKYWLKAEKRGQQ